VVGERSERSRVFAEFLKVAALYKDPSVLLADPSEAEAIQLFANTFLAMRAAFSNELDNYTLATGTDAQNY
jgi:UDPglucose 6-dehydrogenase